MATTIQTPHHSTRRITTRTHGMLDYAFGLVLMASSWFLPFGEATDARIAFALGLATLAYSAMTDYEFAAIRILPFSVHLFLDILVGIMLLGAPLHFQSRGLAAI